MRNVYIFVEGNTDKALIATLLQKGLGFQQFEYDTEMSDLLKCQLPKYPGADGALEAKGRPLFLHKEEIGIMIAIAGGKEKMAAEIYGRLMVAERSYFGDQQQLSVAVIIDRDLETDDEKIKKRLADSLNKKGVNLENDVIHCFDNQWKASFYSIPASGIGAVESVVLNMASVLHPELTEEAGKYRGVIEKDEKYETYRKSFASASEIQQLYADKVQVGAISAVLKPDSSPALMIQDKLIRKENIEKVCEIQEVKRLLEFLREL